MNEQELFEVELPEKTASYSPVSHRQIIETAQELILGHGLEISKKKYNVARDGKVMNGIYQINAANSIFSYQIGFQNSYDKTLPVAFVGGVTVLICSNGMVIGDIKFLRKHTGSVSQELDDKILEVVRHLDENLTDAERQAEQMKQIELTSIETAELCGRFFMEEEIITSSQLNIIKSEIKKPTYADFNEPTLWSLYNHTTHSLKKTHPNMYLRQHEALHKFVSDEFEIY